MKNTSKFFIVSALLFSTGASFAVECGTNGGRASSYSKNWFGDLYTVTDCYCKNPCAADWQGDSQTVLAWCEYAKTTRCGEANVAEVW